MTCKNSKNVINKLLFGSLNVCGLKNRINYPEFLEVVSNYDVFCVTETKTDHTDVISVPGYSFLSQQRKQKFIRKSGGIGVLYKNHLKDKITLIETDSDYILWVRFDKSIFESDEDFILGILYVPPAQSRFLNEDEYLNLETEITLMCGQSAYICLTGDMNARTAELSDFITADSFIADMMDFDQETLNFFNQAELLKTLNINEKRVSCDKKTNNNGYKLIEICINNNLFILNGRFGKDTTEGKLTFRDQSLIDYTICSFNSLKHLLDFEVIETDSVLSDGHALLSWSFSAGFNDRPSKDRKPVNTYRKWDQRYIDDFMNNIPNTMLNDIYLNLEPTEESINYATLQLSNILTQAAKLSFPINFNKTNFSKEKTWFGPNCYKARKIYHLSRKKYKRFRNNVNRERLLQTSKSYKRTMNFYINKQKETNAKKLREIHSSNPKDYWRYLNSLKKTSNSNMPPLSKFYEHFKDINSSSDSETFSFDEYDFNIHDANETLNTVITENEIASAIRGLKLGKASGYDEILNEYIKCTQDLLMPCYIKLFNIIFDTGILPEAWLEGKIRPIYKNKGDQSEPSNYRPITVLSCLSKLFTSILNNRLTKFLDTHDALNENQAGFRKGYSVTDHIFSLNTLIELLRSQKKKLYCAFIDFSQAFDSVWRVGLWKKLLSNSINGKFFQVVHNMYKGIKSSISLNGENSPFFACDCGVRQGENLSPLLFALYLNDLEAFLMHKNLAGITIEIDDEDMMIYMKLFSILYADDTVLMADSPTDLQNCLNAFAIYCKEWKLNINVAKTKVLIFGARKTSHLQFNIDDHLIDIVDKYKYLGIYFSQSGSFLYARKHIVQQAKKAMILLFTRINNLDIPLDLQLKVFDHTVLPILTYACEIWGYESLEMIEKVQNDFLRKITLSKKSTPLYMLYGELGRYPLEIIVKSRMVGFWNRVVHGKETKLSFLFYQCLLHSPETNSKWLTCIQSIFIQVGRPDIWYLQQKFQLKSLSYFIKKLLIDQYIQHWYSKGSQSSKAIAYFCFKREFTLEKYFILLPRKLYTQFYRIRTGNHKLPVETGRWDGTELQERTCSLCTLNDIGDEFHYIITCPYFQVDRRKYLKPYYIQRPSMYKFCELLNSKNKVVLTKLSKFVGNITRSFI